MRVCVQACIGPSPGPGLAGAVGDERTGTRRRMSSRLKRFCRWAETGGSTAGQSATTGMNVSPAFDIYFSVLEICNCLIDCLIIISF